MGGSFRAFTDSRGDAFDRPMPDVADREDPWQAGFQEHWQAPERPCLIWLPVLEKVGAVTTNPDRSRRTASGSHWVRGSAPANTNRAAASTVSAAPDSRSVRVRPSSGFVLCRRSPRPVAAATAASWLRLTTHNDRGSRTYLVEKRIQARGEVPLLPPSLLRLRSVSRGLVMVLIFSMSFGAFMFVLALTVQDGLHADALRGGLSVLPMAVAFLAGSLVAARLITRFGRGAMSVGALVQLAGLAWLVTVLASGWPQVSLWIWAGRWLWSAPGSPCCSPACSGPCLPTCRPTWAASAAAPSSRCGGAAWPSAWPRWAPLYLALQSHSYPRAFVAVECIQMAIVVLLAIGAAALPRFTSASADAPLADQ
jgi:hypothetical protein